MIKNLYQTILAEDLDKLPGIFLFTSVSNYYGMHIGHNRNTYSNISMVGVIRITELT